MKKRTMKELLKDKVFIYISGRVKIKSDIQLSNEQVTKICDIIYSNMDMLIYYGQGYQIARSIFHQIGPPICRAKFYYKRRKFFVELIKRD